MKRTALFISDSTGITASALGKLLEHFPHTEFSQVRLPFTDTPEKIQIAKQSILKATAQDGIRPVVIMSLGNLDLRNTLKEADAYFIDLFTAFIDPLGIELGEQPLTGSGIAHGIMGSSYSDRMEAINFTLNHDDGMTNSGLEEAQVILVGVSRCGKTPTSIYLAMQFGIKAANYPLIPEDFERGQLPKDLIPYRSKIFGLMIDAERLSEIRNERRPGSNYAKLENCRYEINEATAMMKKESIPWVATTSKSIEEIATTVLQSIKSDKTILG